MLKMGTRRVVSNDDDDDNDREKGAHLRRGSVGDVVVDEVGDDVGDDNADVAKSERHQRRAKSTTTTTSKGGLTNIGDIVVGIVEDSELAGECGGKRGKRECGGMQVVKSQPMPAPQFCAEGPLIYLSRVRK